MIQRTRTRPIFWWFVSSTGVISFITHKLVVDAILLEHNALWAKIKFARMMPVDKENTKSRVTSIA